MPPVTPTVETLDEVAPRLREFCEELISRLQRAGLSVTTFETWLLDNPSYPIKVPHLVGGVSIQMTFMAKQLRHMKRVQPALQLSFAHGRKWSFLERVGGTFPISLIVKKFSTEIGNIQRSRKYQARALGDQERAKKRLAELAKRAGLGVDPNDPLKTQEGPVKIQAVRNSTTKVSLTLPCSYEQAAEILERYNAHSSD